MFIGIGKTLPQIADLPGPSRPGHPSGSDERLITVWRTTTPNEDITLWGGNTSVALAARMNDLYNYEVDWGDGSTETVVGVRNKTHTYATPGDHEVKITGQYGGFQFSNAPQTDRDKLIELKNWGISKLWGLNYTFFNCTQLDVTATDAPYFDGTGNLALRTADAHSTFRVNKTVNLDLSKFDLSWATRFAYFIADNNYAETIKMPDGLTTNAYDHTFMMRYTGTNTVGGTEITWNNYTNTYNGINISQIVGYSKAKKIDFNNWSINKCINPSNAFTLADLSESELNLKNWTTNSGGDGFTTFASMLRGGTARVIDTTGWNASVSENVNSWSHIAYSAQEWQEWKGLSDISLKSVSNATNALARCKKLRFKSGGGNFSNDSSPDGSFSLVNSFFLEVGSLLSTTELDSTEPPNVSNWNMSNVSSFASMFFYMAAGDEIPNVNSWDLSSATSLSGLFYLTGVTGYTKPAYIDWRNANISSSLTSFTNFNRIGPVQSIDLRGADLSGVTSFSHSWYQPRQTLGGDKNDLRFIIDSSTSFASLNTGTNWLQTAAFRTSDYDNIIQRLRATNINTGYQINASLSKFTGDLVWPSNLTVQMTGFSVATEVTDTNADFVTASVTAGDIVFVKSGSTYKWAEVVSVDSSTKLTINAAIVNIAFSYYNVCKSQVAKDKYHLIASDLLTIVDSGPVIS